MNHPVRLNNDGLDLPCIFYPCETLIEQLDGYSSQVPIYDGQDSERLNPLQHLEEHGIDSELVLTMIQLALFVFVLIVRGEEDCISNQIVHHSWPGAPGEDLIYEEM